MNKPGTLTNDGLRMFSACLLLSAQAVFWSGACNQANLNGNAANDGTITDGDGSGGDDGVTGSGGDVGTVDSPPAVATASVDGYWISTRSETGTELLGLATGGQIGDAVSIDISENDGGSWSFSGQRNGDKLDGSCRRPLSDDDLNAGDFFGGLGGLTDDPPVCTGVFSQDGDTLTLTADDNGQLREWTLKRSTSTSPSMIGFWRDPAAADFGLVSAFDGRVLSLLDPSDRQRQFDAVWDADSGGFVGTDADGYQWVGLPQGDSELFIWVEDFGTFVEQRTVVRQVEPATSSAPLTGRWMSSFNTGELTNTLRGQASVIFDGTNLYVHQRDDDHRVLFSADYDLGGYWSIFATYDGTRFESTTDSTTIWSGIVDGTGTVIHGHSDGDETRSFGFVKVTSAPSGEDLAGTWSSVSSDYETPSQPTQTTGQAQVSFDGAKLTIQDNSGDADFVIEADWMGDHFEGEWWPANDPTDRLRWSGEFVLGGALLHGKWERGEWSFTPFALQTRSSLGDVESGTVAIVADPFEDIAASYRNDAANLAVTMYRREGVVNRFSFVGAAGTVEMTVDERFRPLTVTGPDLSATLAWSADSSSVEVTVVQNGTSTTETVQLDLSDQALLAMISQMETQVGVNGDGLRAWIADNPGRLAAVARGDEVPPSLSDPYAKRAPTTRSRYAKNSTAPDVARRVVNDGAAIGGLIWGTVAAHTAALAATSATVALAFSALTFLAIAAVGFLLAFFIFDFIIACFPCTLSCFWNCGVSEQPRRACCISGGGCITATATECSNFSGTYLADEQSCRPNPCQ